MIIVHMGKPLFNRLIGLGGQFEQDSGLHGQIYDIGSGAVQAGGATVQNAESSSTPKVQSGRTRAIDVSDECTTRPYSEAAYNGNSEDPRLFGTSPLL